MGEEERGLRAKREQACSCRFGTSAGIFTQTIHAPNKTLIMTPWIISGGSLLLNDLYCFRPAANTYMALSPSGTPPSLRQGMGFAVALDGVLYVFGGLNASSGDSEV
jgi:hypothetical protein